MNSAIWYLGRAKGDLAETTRVLRSFLDDDVARAEGYRDQAVSRLQDAIARKDRYWASVYAKKVAETQVDVDRAYEDFRNLVEVCFAFNQPKPSATDDEDPFVSGLRDWVDGLG